MTPEEITQWVNDAKRRSFENGWKAAIKKTCDFFDSISCCGLVEDIEAKELVEKYKRFMED